MRWADADGAAVSVHRHHSVAGVPGNDRAKRFTSYAKLQHQAVLLTSYLVGKAGGGLNAVGGIDSNGRLVGVHRKVNLAPFGEVELERGAGFHAFSVLPNAKVVQGFAPVMPPQALSDQEVAALIAYIKEVK